MKYFIYSVIAVVAASVIGGFFLVGSPKEERLRRFDQQKVDSLQMIQGQIGEFYRAKERIPKNLAELNDEFRGVILSRDPETGKEYEYELKEPLMFSLCADFNRPSISDASLEKPLLPASFGFQNTWEHGQGRVCFERTIDKDFLPPLKTPR